MKKILVIENEQTHFELIAEALQSNGFEVFPRILNNNRDNWTKLISECALYVLQKASGNNTAAELKKLISETVMENTIPDAMVIDIALGHAEDEDGGVVRKDVLADLYKGIKCLFLTTYNNDDIESFRCEGDLYTGKNQNGISNLKYLIRKDVVYKIKKLTNSL